MTGILNAIIAGVSGAVKDTYFNLVSLLLPGNGTNGAQNNTFLDGSSNNFTITRNGNTTQGTFSPFSQTGWGNYFSGASDYLNYSTITLGSSFTLEFFIYFANTPSANAIILNNANAGGGTNWVGVSNTAVALSYGATTRSFSFTPAGGTWYYVQIINSSSSLTCYVNGSQVGTSQTGPSSFTLDRIVGYASNGLTGYLSNVRINSTALAVSATPTSPLTNVAGTVLLTCQSNRFIDNSGSPLTLTRGGSVSVVAFSPFAPTAAYTTAAVGGSGYFDGTGDYLEAGTASNWTFLSNTTALFSIEAWVYLSAAPATLHPIVFTNGASSANVGFGFWINSSRGVGAEITIGSTGVRVLDATTTGTIQLGAWNFVAITYDQSLASGNCKIYINNAAAETFNKTANAPSSSNPATTLLIGRSNSSTHAIGYYGILRVSNVIRTITVPTAPYISDANTSLLLNYTNAGITDATAKNDLETVGNAQISTAISAKWGSGSMYFDGAGDYLNFPSSQLFGLGTGDFTIEFWLYLNTVSGTQNLCDFRNATATEVAITLYMNLASPRLYVNGADRITGGNLSTGQWYHVALTRSSTSTKLFVGGTQSGSTYTDSNNYLTPRPLRIGMTNDGTTQFPLNAYIQDFRVTLGYARYTGSTIPVPSAPFPVQ